MIKIMMRTLTVIGALMGTVLFAALPANAQENPTYPVDTITVVGEGSAPGTPDIANINIGVRTVDPDVETVFERSNNTVESVIQALVDQGAAREDIRTVNIYLFQNENFDPASGGPALDSEGRPQIRYELNNELRVTVRDTANVSEVISAAVEAGANNIFNLSFGFEDQGALENEALALAVDDARAQAERIAELANVELGEILLVSETGGNGFPSPFERAQMSGMGGGGGGVPIEAGQLSVSTQIQVTFRIAR